MGTLRYFNLQPLMESYGCRTLFETGTGIGDGVRYAAFYAFDAIYTVEIHPDIAATARERFIDDPRVQVLNETSEAALARVTHRLQTMGEREIPSRRIGELVMEELRALDEVAYVRYASVYRSFQDVESFQEEIRRMRELGDKDRRRDQLPLLPDESS